MKIPYSFLAAILSLLLTDVAVADTRSEMLTALGGERALQQIETLSWRANGENLEPAQTLNAGAPGRHVSDYRATVTWAPKESRAALRWRIHTYYPFEATWRYSERIDGEHGSIEGRDGFRPSKGGPMPATRLAARLKALWLENPGVLLSLGEKTSTTDDANPLEVNIAGSRWTIWFDVATQLPIRVTTQEQDPLLGRVENSVQFLDWRRVGGIMFPHRLEQRVGGALIRRERRSEISLNNPIQSESSVTEVAEVTVQDRELAGWGKEMSHWFLRRIAMGAPADRDQSVHVKLRRAGRGVYQLLGSSHHTLVIETERSLVLVDAPLYPRRSKAIIKALKENWPQKPVSHVILTHHHYDHSGGIRSYAEAQAEIVVAAINKPFFDKILQKTVQGPVQIYAAGDRETLQINGREIQLYDIPNSHAAGMLAVYLPDERLLFNTDLYSPGRKKQHPLWSSELLESIRYYGIEVDHVVGGHGKGKEPLSKLAATVAGSP